MGQSNGANGHDPYETAFVNGLAKSLGSDNVDQLAQRLGLENAQQLADHYGFKDIYTFFSKPGNAERYADIEVALSAGQVIRAD